MTEDKLAIGISGSPSRTSSSRRLVERVLALLAERDFATDVVDLSTLPAEALLARGEDAAVSGALARVGDARVLVVGTPVYRATYTALLKTLFDLMPEDYLSGKIAVLIATGAAPGHMLAIDHGLRPLIASLGGVSAATAIYATPADFVDGEPGEALAERLAVLIATGAALGHMLAIDHGLRPLIASLGGVSAATGIYATPADFVDDEPGEKLAARLTAIADEAYRLARS